MQLSVTAQYHPRAIPAGFPLSSSVLNKLYRLQFNPTPVNCCHYARKSLSPSNERTNGKSNLGEKRNNKRRVGFISYFKILNSDTLEAIVKCNREDWTKISRKRDKSDRNKQISLSRSISLSLSLVSRYNTPHCWIHLRSRIFKSFLFQTVFDTEISKA